MVTVKLHSASQPASSWEVSNEAAMLMAPIFSSNGCIDCTKSYSSDVRAET